MAVDRVTRQMQRRGLPVRAIHGSLGQSEREKTLADFRAKNGTIPGAVPIPRGVLELNIDQVTTDKNKNIVLYCGGGSRSALAAQSLKKMGFKNVISLAGGYRGWSQS